MKPIEFVLWLNGASGIVGDTAPTQEQWGKMREKLGETVGQIMAKRLFERADNIAQEDEDSVKRREYEVELSLRRLKVERDMMVTMHQNIGIAGMGYAENMVTALAADPAPDPTYGAGSLLKKNF